MNQNKTGKAYWRSLDELADTPKFRRFLETEFANEVIESPNRRSFVKLMGASIALGGALTGCRRWPQRTLAPYNVRPDGHIPGTPDQYATALDLGGVARPLLVSSFEGRPTKVEGNPSHPQSGGAADVLTQASVLEMYDPERSRNVTDGGEASTWAAFADAFKGKKLAVLAGNASSPTLSALKGKLSGATFYHYEPLNRDNEVAGTRLAFGRAVRPLLSLDRAEVIATFDADLFGTHPSALANARGWAKGRAGADYGKQTRMYSTDAGLTITSTNADVRLPYPSTQIIDVAKAVAHHLGAGVSASSQLTEAAAEWASRLAEDLKTHRGKAVAVAGSDQGPEVHAAIAMINEAIGAVGSTVSYVEDPAGQSNIQQLSSLVDDMNGGAVSHLLILGGNPVYDAPVDLGFADALKKVTNTAHLSGYVNETSTQCAWNLPESHYLEAWGDARSWDGTVSVVQPLIQPLYDSKSAIEVMALLAGDSVIGGYELVRREAKAYLPAATFGRAWRKSLHDGLVAGSGFAPADVRVVSGAAAKVEAARAGEGLELVFRQDYSVYDGRFGNNGWLQELPDPVTKLTWDNAAYLSPTTAQRLGLEHGDKIQITASGVEFPVPVFIVPGQARDSIGVSIGYGRTAAGNVGNKVGFDVLQARTSDAMGAVAGIEVSKLRGSYEMATTQDHHAIDETGLKRRDKAVFGDPEHHSLGLVRSLDVDSYKENPSQVRQYHLFGDLIGSETYTVDQRQTIPLQIFDAPEGADYNNEETDPTKGEYAYRWGMAIDLNACIGCAGCTVACQAENNIPIVGKDNVIMGREMHWIRVDRYYKADGDLQHDGVKPEMFDNPEVIHQPLACHHCETAPCEQVCPVAATTHDSEGLNAMVYNRCIGTRYCANNCPYKVRRFNYFDYHAKDPHKGPVNATWLDMPDKQQVEMIDPVRKMQFNPEVTVRMRGVMEKCTFCLQRIKAVTIPARNAFVSGERDSLRLDDRAEVPVPACAQTCPTDAIVFGDLNDPTSRVYASFNNLRSYEMLKEINVRARTRYLARVTNRGEVHDDHGSEHETSTTAEKH
jgi:molybdopterin-containing oxidoreductase family iron-sulfur binding subunit